MTKTQKAAAEAIIGAFLKYAEERRGELNETYIDPTTGKTEANAVFVDLRQLKLLAGLPVESE